jgi:hypothetical protein
MYKSKGYSEFLGCIYDLKSGYKWSDLFNIYYFLLLFKLF